MPTVHFTANLVRHVSCPAVEVEGATVGEVLARVFELNPRLRGYVVDEQGVVRKHMNVFVDGEQLRDRERLADAVSPDAQIYVMQALSGGGLAVFGRTQPVRFPCLRGRVGSRVCVRSLRRQRASSPLP